jgi:nucleotide-binding universal stress UspA family protein
MENGFHGAANCFVRNRRELTPNATDRSGSLHLTPEGLTPMYKNILIATDGSELANKGVRQGLALAEKLGAKVTFLSVVAPLAPEAIQAAIASGIPDPIGGYDQQIEEGMKKRYAALEQEAAQYGITVDVLHEIDESPAEAIVRVAEIKACDLIVMASHGRRGIRKALLGSQTAEVLVIRISRFL